MDFSRYNSQVQQLLARAEALLGSAVRPVEIDWDLEQLLKPHLRRERQQGFGSEHALLSFDDGRPGHEVVSGLEQFRLNTDDYDIKLAKVTLPYFIRMSDFWAVPLGDCRRFYRFLRGRLRKSRRQLPPIVDDAVLQRLSNNTIGFLRRSHRQLEEFDVPRKRGVLLLGPPGNGKTMACRWLRSRCLKYALDWTTVTRQSYEQAVHDGTVAELFQPWRDGVVLFDDFDEPLKNRNVSADRGSQSTFLAELDGINPKSGVVYLFTSNMSIDEVDAAVRRPGRIDVVLSFGPPDAARRREFITRRWHRDIAGGISVDQVVADTEGLSFAEMEEARKLLALNYFDSGRFDWPKVREMLVERSELAKSQRPIGFSAASDRQEPSPHETVAGKAR